MNKADKEYLDKRISFLEDHLRKDPTTSPTTLKPPPNSPPNSPQTLPTFNTFPYKLPSGTYKIESLSSPSLNTMPPYQHLPVLPRKTSKQKLLFQEKFIFNDASDNHLPDLSSYGISENNLKDDPILLSPQLQTAHTLHQLPKHLQQCNQPSFTQPSQTDNLHNFLQEKLDRRQSKILDQLAEDESFHQQHT